MTTEKISVKAVEPVVRSYAFQENPGLNPDVKLKIEEIEVSDLRDALKIQLFFVRYLSTDGTEGNQRLLIYCDGKVTPFARCGGGHGLCSAVVVGNKLYYTDSCGSGLELSHIGQVSIDGGKIGIVESTTYNMTHAADTDLFVKDVGGRVRVEVGQFVALNSWKAAREVGWVKSDGPALKIVDDQGADVPEEKVMGKDEGKAEGGGRKGEGSRQE